MTDLHVRLRAEVEQRLAVAEAAKLGYFAYEPPTDLAGEDSAVIAYHGLFNPAVTIAWLRGELEVLERHWQNGAACEACWRVGSYATEAILWPCPEIFSLASRLGVSVE